MKKGLAILLVLVILAALTPMTIGLINCNSGNYASAANLLKFYPFLEEQYLEAIRGAGDQCMESGSYTQAISWYEQLGEAGVESVSKAYCAMAVHDLKKNPSVSQFLSTVEKIPETTDTIPLRDQAILEAANHFFSLGNLEDAASLLRHVVSADVSPVRNQINSVYMQEALAFFPEVTVESDYQADEPKAFALMRSALECLNKCEESLLATYFSQAIQSLLDRNIDRFMDAVGLLSAQAGSDPLAGETAWTLWNCFGHVVSSDNSSFMGYSLPYDILDNVLSVGNTAAKLADPANTHSGSLLDSLAELAKDGDIRRWKQGLCEYDSPLTLTLDRFGRRAGDPPKLLFIRNYLPISVAPQEYCMDFAIDLNMMARLPLEYWPSSMDDVTHIVSLHYFHEEMGKYNTGIYGAIGIGGSPGIKETAHVRIYSASDSKILYESEHLTGPDLPHSVSSNQIVSGYYSSGAIDLSQQLVKALQEVFPDLK